jgi:DNA-binding FadR family transcriptional regulator
MTLMRLKPPAKRRLADELYGQLLEQIVSGAMVPGDKLPTEKELCRAMHVSRPVVREALLRLNADGFVKSRRGSGTTVLMSPSREISRFIQPGDLSRYMLPFEVRIGLEPEAARLAAQRRTEEDLARINSACHDLAAAIASGASAQKHDLAFHQAVAVATGNDLFSRQLATLDQELQGFMSVSLGLTGLGSSERKRIVLLEHVQIAEAIAIGDGELAWTYMRYHISQARQRMIDATRQP